MALLQYITMPVCLLMWIDFMRNTLTLIGIYVILWIPLTTNNVYTETGGVIKLHALDKHVKIINCRSIP